mgnify:CR=1 FL=1
MRVALMFTLVLFAIGFAACRGSDSPDGGEPIFRDGGDKLNPRGVTSTVTPATRMVRVIPRVREPRPPETPGTLKALADTTWRAGDFTFAFEPGGHLIVRGGHFDDLAKAGVPGRVVNRSGVLTIEILGRTTYGTWDGETLIIEDVEADRLEPELALRPASGI